MGLTGGNKMFDFSVLDDLDAIFNDSFVQAKSGYVAPSFPPSDMIQKKDGTIEITLALAGYSKEDIKVSTEENRVVISTVQDYKSPTREDGTKVIVGNIKHSAFTSKFFIPETKFNFADISAKFDNGLLSLTIPPKEKKEYKAISIN